jgi:ABC-2 type transport system permease protein
MKAITALYVANAKAFLRDRTAGFLVLLMPVALAAFFGLVFSGGGGYTLHLGVVDEDGGVGGQPLLAALEGAEMDQALALHRGTRAEMQEALTRGDVSVVVLLPRGLTTAVGAGQPATIEAWYDPAQPTSAGVGLGLVRTIVSEASLAISDAPRLLVMEETSVTTHPLRAVDFQVPGMLGVALLWLGLFGTALPLVQQRETKALRRLSVTPLRPAALLTAQVAWRVTVALLQAALFLLVGYVGFGVQVEGSWPLLVGTVALGALVFITLGTFLAGLALSAGAVSAIVQVVNLPMMMLSGSLMAVESLPDFFRPVVAAMPLTYLSDALRQIIVAAPPLHPLWVDFAVLGGWLVFFFVLAARLWRWE